MFLSFLRTVLLYLALVIVIRLMGKRQIGEMEPSEFVVAILIADLASVPMQDIGIPLLYGLIPILTVGAVELIFSYLSLRSTGFRKLFCGTPVILMENGKILPSGLRKTRISVNELMEHLRENGIVDLSTVQYAILETNGKISALPYPKHAPATAKDAGVSASPMELPVAVISDGQWVEENLKLVQRDKAWIAAYLAKQNCTVTDVLLLTLCKSGKPYLAKREESP